MRLGDSVYILVLLNPLFFAARMARVADTIDIVALTLSPGIYFCLLPCNTPAAAANNHKQCIAFCIYFRI